MADWKLSYSQQDREDLILKIYNLLKDSAGGPVSVADKERLYSAAKAFEEAVFTNAFTMDEYVSTISAKVKRIKDTAHGEKVPEPAPVALATPQMLQRAVLLPKLPDNDK